MTMKRLPGCGEEMAPANLVWVLLLAIVSAASVGIAGRPAEAQTPAGSAASEQQVDTTFPLSSVTPQTSNSPVRISARTMAKQVISRVDPVYPPEAKAAHLQGFVVLRAVVGKNGNVSNVTVVSGPLELVQSAIDAVSQWRYKPYLLNGEPVEVETRVNVSYWLADSGGASPYRTPGVAAADVRLVGGGVSAPQLIYKVDPEFSEEARKARADGVVVIGLIVDTRGIPRKVHVVRGIGMGLDDKAFEAVRDYRFKPAMLDGKPVPVEVNVEVNFKYADKPLN
jgi:TonB family protein